MRQVRRLKHLFAVVPLLFAVLGAANGQFPCGFTAKNLGSTSGTPVDLCQLDGTRHLVVEKRGVVTLLRTSPSSSKRVLDIQDKVRDGGEGGLLSCAVDPEFPREPWVYFGYIAHGGASAGQKRVSKFRYNIQAESIDKGSEVVLVGDCSAGGNMCMRQEREFHTTVSLQFGTDGALYVATGDQATGGSASQDTSDQSTGKILRINKADGRGFADNPFCDGAGLGQPRCRVWAYGFRNPWTFDVIPGTSDLLVFHVGEGSYESVVRVGRGTNVGWPCYEGRNKRWSGCAGFDASRVVYQYSHDGNGASISGGTLFGSQFPDKYARSFLFADYVRDTSHVVGYPGGSASWFGSMNRVARVKKGRVDGLIYVLRMDDGILRLSWDTNSRCDGIGAFTPNNPLEEKKSTTTRTTKTLRTRTRTRSRTSSRAVKTSASSISTSTPKMQTSLGAPVPSALYSSGSTTKVTSSMSRWTRTRRTRTRPTSTMTEAFCGPDPAISPIVPWMDLKETTSVSDYRFVELRSNGLGPIESDMAVGGQAAGDGRPMTIRGRRFGKGFGTRIPSQVMIPLRRVCSRFITYVGIDDSGGGRGSAEALIYADGDLIYNSTEDLGMILTNGVGPVKVEIDVRDVGRIRLIGDLPWVFRYAKEEHLKHSNLNWAEPIVHCGPTSSKLPRVEITPLGANPEVADIGSSVSFSGSAFSARGAALANIWTVNLWHCQGSLCHIHPDIAHGIGGNFTFTLVEHPNCIFFEVKLSAGDVCGRVGTDSFFVRSRTNDAECRL